MNQAKHYRVMEMSSKNSQMTPEQAAESVEQVLKVLAGRWKLLILFNLFGGQVHRYSDLMRLVPGISEKMLSQTLRQLERAGVVNRVVHPEVPPRVEYSLTALGEELCPSLDAMVCWTWLRDSDASPQSATSSVIG